MDANESSRRNTVEARRNSEHGHSGIYLGKVTHNVDGHMNGRIRVFIKKLQTYNAEKGNYDVSWTSPFVGSTNLDYGPNTTSASDTGRSYGMWTPPPEVGNLVLVAFADGNPKYGYIISNVLPNFQNYSLPGNPRGLNHGEDGGVLPAMEPNPNNTDKKVRPVEVEQAKRLTQQGTINDEYLGPGDSGARRESPSEVFGISTPGPKLDPESKQRLSGHSFVMDDHLDSRMIRLRTGRGMQIVMNVRHGSDRSKEDVCQALDKGRRSSPPTNPRRSRTSRRLKWP